MGLRDNELIFSDEQAITATAYGSSEINSGLVSRSLGEGSPLNVRVKIMADFTNLTDLTIQLAAGAATAPTTLVGPSQNVLLAGLTKGKEFVLPFPHTTARYWRIKYTVNGSAPDAGKVSAWIDPGSGGYNG